MPDVAIGNAAAAPSPAPLGFAGGSCGGIPPGFIVASAMIHSLFSHLLGFMLSFMLGFLLSFLLGFLLDHLLIDR
jgi:hypothetical protein